MSEQMGYGYQPSQEDLARVRMSELRRQQEELDRQREMLMTQERQERWAQQGATRTLHRPFTPQNREDYHQYDPYDVHRGSVRRMSDAVEYEDARMDTRMSSIPRGAHVMDDPGLLEDILKETMLEKNEEFDAKRQAREVEAMQNIAWEEAKMAKMGLRRDDGSRMSASHMTSGKISKTANETAGGNRFGIRDYMNAETARQNHEAMMARCADHKNSIQRKYASAEERRQEMFDRERVRSTTLQGRFANCSTLGNLSDRLRELDQRSGQRQNPYEQYPEEYQEYFRKHGGDVMGHTVSYM